MRSCELVLQYRSAGPRHGRSKGLHLVPFPIANPAALARCFRGLLALRCFPRLHCTDKATAGGATPPTCPLPFCPADIRCSCTILRSMS